MGSVSAYIISIIAVCICCAIVQKLVGQGSANAVIIKSLCGITIAVAAITPIIKINISGIADYLDRVQFESSVYANTATDTANNELRTVITEKTKAYILEKATNYDCDILHVDVSVSADSIPVPDSVTIAGIYSPYIKKQISGLIESNLGISKEKQQWIYQN